MKPRETLPGTDLVHHTIDTGDARHIQQVHCRVPIHQHAELEADQLHKLQADGIIEPGTEPWASPLVLVRKKDDSLRCCSCYPKLNAVTKKDVSRIDDSLDMLSGSVFFSTIDLALGYCQVKMDPNDKEKAAVATHIGLFFFFYGCHLDCAMRHLHLRLY